MPVDAALRVDIQLVGCRRNIVRTLSVYITICHNPLAALLEVKQLVAQLLYLSHICRQGAALDVDTLDVFICLSLLDGAKRLFQPKIVECISSELAEDVLRSPLLHHSAEIDHQHRVLLHILRSLTRCNHTDKTHHAENDENDKKKEQTNEGCQHILDEIFHINNCIKSF